MANKKGIILKDGSMSTDPKIIAREEKNELIKNYMVKKLHIKWAVVKFQNIIQLVVL